MHDAVAVTLVANLREIDTEAVALAGLWGDDRQAAGP
jgi:hypothetical protein